MNIIELLFVISAALLVYVYLGYPLILLVAVPKRREPNTAIRTVLHDAALPRVSLLISAYNEHQVISKKLRNALDLDYPRDLLEILVISDCSDDGTDEIVGAFAADGVQLVRQPERLGKSMGLNVGVSRATGELLVFSDANAIYEADAIRQLVRHFVDARVGYVVGNARYSDAPGQQASAKSEGLYWRLETWLKEKESDFGSVVGGDGAIYAIRRELFSPLRPTDINDFLNPLQIIVRGYRGVYEPAAICYEEAGDSFEKEFGRKVRIVSRSLNAVWRASAVLLPWVQPRHWFSLVSHKVLRWFAPVLMILALVSSWLLWRSSFYQAALLLQLCFYLLAFVGWRLEGHARLSSLLYIPYYFTLVNLASFYGILKFFGGSLTPTWQTVRASSAPPRISAADIRKKGS